MGRRRKGKRPDGGEERVAEPCYRLNDEEREAAPLIAAHPSAPLLVLASHARLVVLDCRNASKTCELRDDQPVENHTECVRCLAFSKDGGFLASAGDDKLVKLWDTASWKCLRSWMSPKKVSALAFTPDGRWLCFANKFGEVLTVPCDAGAWPERAPDQPLVPGEGANLLLSHCCSIVTAMDMPPHGKLIVTADRDEKVRVSHMPRDPASGAHEISAFCLGHRSFVTCLTSVVTGAGETLLATGGGDATVRLWRPETGTLLDTFDLSSDCVVAEGEAPASSSGPEAEEGGEGTECQSEGEGEGALQELTRGAATVVSLAAAADGKLAVGVQGYSDVVMLRVQEGCKLVLSERLVTDAPTRVSSIAFDSDGKLCAVGQPLPALDAEPAEEEGMQSSHDQATTALTGFAALPDSYERCLLASEAKLFSAFRLVAASGADAKSMVYTSRAAALGSVVPIKGMLKRKITELEREQRKSNRVDKRLNAPTKQDPKV